MKTYYIKLNGDTISKRYENLSFRLKNAERIKIQGQMESFIPGNMVVKHLIAKNGYEKGLADFQGEGPYLI